MRTSNIRKALEQSYRIYEARRRFHLRGSQSAGKFSDSLCRDSESPFLLLPLKLAWFGLIIPSVNKV
ncbi:hypothetical protein ACRRTK_021867 [Alexandromys fortis]